MLDKAENVVAITAIGSGVCLFVLAMLAFFVQPSYTPLVDTAIGAFKDVFLVSAGVKAGLAIPKKDG